MAQLRSLSFVTVLVSSVAASSIAVGCGGGDAPADAAIGDDAFRGPEDGGPAADAPTSGLGTCASPRRVTLAIGESMTISGNTAGGAAGGLALGAACTNPDISERPPQEVVAVEVPGSGEVGIAFNLTTGTAATFDTIVEVRTACETTPTSVESCFDDVAEDEVRSAGAFTATGGTTVYLVVSGYPGGEGGTISAGSYTMQLEAEPNASPTLTAATARRVDDDRLEVTATGMDADTNAVGVGFQLLAGDGTPLALDAAVADDLGPYFYPFDLEVTTASFAMQLATAPGSADFDGIGAATTLRLFTYDAYGARSATRDVVIDMVTEVGFGGTCTATSLCRAPNVCDSGTCVASAETLALCSAATSVTLTAPAGSEPSVSTQRASLAAGVGLASGTGCEYTADAMEAVFAVTVPAGTFDLIAATNLAANPADLDTVVYVRSTCANETTELVCDDDYAGAPDGDYRSYGLVENVAAGTHFVFVDGYAPFDATTSVSVELRLRPVLATGAMCDPMGVANRCAGGACPASGTAVCP